MLWSIKVIAINSYARSVPCHDFFSFEISVELYVTHIETRSLLHISVACFKVLSEHWRRPELFFWSQKEFSQWSAKLLKTVLESSLKPQKKEESYVHILGCLTSNPSWTAVTHAVQERLNTVPLIGWIVLLCKNCYYTVCEANHAAGGRIKSPGWEVTCA